jgi:SNF2 family DNA or RNA helicase
MKPVGRAELRGGSWLIEAGPHVLMRLKRVFERIDKSEHGCVSLSDNPENARELRWFAERYPLEFTPRDHLDRQAEAHLARERQVELILSGEYKPPEFKLAVPPRDYQRIAADLALKSGSLLLADDVGLGKTISAIAVLSDPRALPALVVTLTHLPRQWQSEIARFAPALRVHILRKGQPYVIEKTREMKGRSPDVIISNYHKLTGWADSLAGKMKSVVFDEAQELRIPTSHKYRAASHIAEAAQFTIGLTATPVYNYGVEIHSVVDAIAEGALGSRAEFLREWCVGGGGPDDTKRVKDPRALGAHLRAQGYMLRRTRADVGRELPPVQAVPHTIEADPAALDKVSARTAELARIILAQGGQARGEKLRASEELSYLLRQATGIAKAPYVAEFVRLLVESGERVVLYGWHRDVYSIWLDRLADLNPALYTGSESTAAKEESKRRFIAGESRVLIVSLRSGAGLDGLQHVCRTVVFGELDWSPGVHEQCTGRVARDGQKDSVAAYFLLSESGSDPVIADVLGLKRQQSDGIRDPQADLIETLQVEEDRTKKLARAFLEQHGEKVPMEPTAVLSMAGRSTALAEEQA